MQAFLLLSFLRLERIGRAQHCEIGTVIRLLDAAIGEMLNLQTDVQVVTEDISDTDMVAELEVGRKLAIVIVVDIAQIMCADPSFHIPALEAVVLKAKHWGESDVDEILLVARYVAIAIAAPL